MSADLSTTLLDLLRRRARQHRDHRSRKGPARQLRDAEASRSSRCAEALAAAGVTRGDRVGIALPNGLPNIVTFLAASMVGTAAPLNPAYKEDDFRFYLEDTDARFLLLPPDGADEARARRRRQGADHRRRSGRGRRRCGCRRTRPAQPFDAAVGGRCRADPAHERQHRTAEARAADARAAVDLGANVARTYDLTPDDVSLCVMPLFHVHGLVASTLATLATGGTVVVPAKFNPLSFWRVAARLRRHLVLGGADAAPAARSRARSRARKPAGAEKLRFIRSCSASLSPQLMSDLEAAFGAPVLEAYGMTEAAHQMASNPLPPAARKAGSVGPEHRHDEIGIMDGAGNLLKAGERGEVVHPRRQRHHGLREQPGSECLLVHRTAGSAPATRGISTRTATCC